MSHVIFSPDGKYITTTGDSFFSGQDNRTLRIWNASTGKLVISLIGHTRSIWFAQFSQDGKKVLTGSADGTIGIWDNQTGKIINWMPVSPHWDREYYLKGATQGYDITSAQFSPNGRLIATISTEYGKSKNDLKIWETSSGRLIKHLKSYSMTASFSPDNKLLLTTSEIINVASGEISFSLKEH